MRFASVAAAMVCASWTLASAPPSTPGQEHVEVRLAQFDVVVRNARGVIATGLKDEDFVVLEDGSPMEIVAVDEWGGPAAPVTAAPTVAGPSGPSPPPPLTGDKSVSGPERRSFVLVFDALGDSTALRMSQAKHAASSFLRGHVGGTDLAAIYQLDLSLRPLSGLTSNVDDLVRAVDKVTWMASSSFQDDIAESVLSSVSSGSAPFAKERLGNSSLSSAQELDWKREHTYESLSNVASLFGGLPGRRVLVLISPGFPMTTAGDQKTGSGGFTPKFRELVRSLATAGVTVYSLDIGNDLTMGDVTETIDWRVALGNLGMDENTLSDLGLERSLGTGSASSRREFLGVVAGESGGRLLTSTDLSKAFETIQEESSRFYRISCRVPVTQASDRYRKLVVRVKRDGYTVNGRRGRYSDITPLQNPSAGTRAAVETLDRYRPLATRGIALVLPSSGPKTIPVEVIVEALGPVDLRVDERGGAALDMDFHLVARAAGEIVTRYDRSFSATVKPQGVGPVRNAFRVEGRLALMPGIYEVQGSVRLNDPPQLASWSSTVAVPPVPADAGPAFAGAILSPDGSSEAPLLDRPPLADDVDSLTLKPGTRIVPSTQPELESGRALLALFWLRGFAEVDGKPPKLDLGIEVVDAQARALTLPTRVLYFGKEPTGGYRALARIDTAALPAGAYALRLSATASDPSGSARKAVPFVLRPRSGPDTLTSSSAASP